MTEPRLLVISGPIASGKSTVSRALGRRLQQEGATVAVIDLDLVYEMLTTSDGPKDDPETWRRAQAATGELAAALVADGTEVVVVDGDFLAPDDRVALGATARFVTLTVGFDEAKERVTVDPTRTASRDLAFLGRHYDEASEAVSRSAASDLVIDTGSATVIEVVAAVVAWSESSS